MISFPLLCSWQSIFICHQSKYQSCSRLSSVLIIGIVLNSKVQIRRIHLSQPNNSLLVHLGELKINKIFIIKRKAYSTDAKALREILKPNLDGYFKLESTIFYGSMGRTLKRLKGLNFSCKTTDLLKNWLSYHSKVSDIAIILGLHMKELMSGQAHFNHRSMAPKFWGVAFRDVRNNRK